MNSPFGSPQQSQQQQVFSHTLPPEGEESGFYVPPGMYTARVVDIDAKDSKSGNPMWVVKYRIHGEATPPGKQPRGVQGVEGKELTQFLVRTPQAAWKLRPTMAALGLIGPDGVSISFTKPQAIGKGCILEVIDSEYNNKKSSAVDNVYPLPVGAELPKPTGVPF